MNDPSGPIARLVLTDFRNHAGAVLTPEAGLVVLTGENGAGKTNVLEAISLLAPGRGLRRATPGEMARREGPGGFAVAAGFSSGVEIGTGTVASAPERRMVRVNGANVAAASLGEWLTLLWLTPAMDRIFTGTPGDRRRLLDRLTLALVPDHAHDTTRYEAAMRERNRLLAGETPPDPAWLTALEIRMAEHGTAIDTARRETVTLLDAQLATEAEGPFARASLALTGWEGGDLTRLLAEGRRRDAAAGRTLAGPHRSDLAVTHRSKNQPAHLCSTGEQKALLLGLVLAHGDLVTARTGRAPILLLDEVAAHLDPLRRAALFTRLTGKGQVWMTGTEPGLFTGAEATRFMVAEGGVGLT